MPPPFKVPILISYAELMKLKEPAMQELVDLASDRAELLIDSGAFSALNTGVEIKLADYMAWLKRWREAFFGYIALDVLGDPAATDRNLKTMQDAGLSPLPVHVRGDDEARMNELFERAEWVALGGFRRPRRGWAPKSYVALKMKWAAGRRVHWLGYTKHTMLCALRPFSCDSTNAIAGAPWGLCQFYNGGGKLGPTGRFDDWKGVKLNARQRNAIERCGFTLEQFRDARFWRSQSKERAGFNHMNVLPFVVTVDAHVQYARDLKANIGTRAFFATGVSNGFARAILDIAARSEKEAAR